jgi:hypothetical protein
MSEVTVSVRQAVLDLQRCINRDIIGQERVVERLIIALLANGNVLIEGLPGLAKTRAIKSLSKNLESKFSRIQFTPDLLPSDVTGGETYKSDGHGTGTFEFRQGPIFGNLVLGTGVQWEHEQGAKLADAVRRFHHHRPPRSSSRLVYTLPPLNPGAPARLMLR